MCGRLNRKSLAAVQRVANSVAALQEEQAMAQAIEDARRSQEDDRRQRTLLSSMLNFATAGAPEGADNEMEVDLDAAVPVPVGNTTYGVTARGDVSLKRCETEGCQERIRANAVCRRCAKHCLGASSSPSVCPHNTKHRPYV